MAVRSLRIFRLPQPGSVSARLSRCYPRRRSACCAAALACNASKSSVAHLGCFTVLAAALQSPAAAWADDFGVTYNAGSQSEFLTNLAGAAYIVLVIFFLYRVLTRRAKRFKEESLKDRDGRVTRRVAAEEEDPELRKPVPVSPLNAAVSAAQACAIAAVLYWLSSSLDAAMMAKELPVSYTARQITVTVRTIVSGLAYLATFIFAANGLGLTALTIKLLAVGDDEPVAKAKARKPKETLPKVALTSDLEDVMKAFDDVSSVERYRKGKGTDAKG